ncbi:MAG: peptidoglycan DD-metalloendopeptidase family protein [Sulfurovum sp.]|nr:peptidoglycan DD-metalloendopeptidase family protein [Sulfurovum sp.]
MIRFLVLTILLLSFAFAAKQPNIKSLWDKTPKSTAGKIDLNKNDLSQTGKKQNQLNKQLSKIAKSILKAEKENRKLAKVLKSLAEDKESNEQEYNKAKKKIDTFEDKIETLDSTIKKQNSHFVTLLIDQFSLMIAMNKMEKKTVDSVVMKEIFDTYKEKNSQDLKTLKKKINSSMEKKKEAQGYQKKIEKSISKISKKRKTYIRKKAEKEKLLKKLATDEGSYRKNIKELMKKQSMIRTTLVKLNIIRKDEISKEQTLEKARQEEINRRAAARSMARDSGMEDQVVAKSFVNKEKVRQIGSSYHKSKIYRYRGAKTISPLKKSRVVKSFGTYVDPIYKMKIFNESITLKAQSQNAKVRNVLNGKVVFAGQNSMLGKVIVIAHGGDMHTIYAGLSRISPVIKQGSRVKKGAIIGKVKSKLIFEATKNSKYINPLRLIRL